MCYYLISTPNLGALNFEQEEHRMYIVWSGPEMGERIRRLRKRRKISQRALSGKVGLSVYWIRAIERGEVTEADADVFSALCDALNVEMEVLTRME